jgi:hypothetical protein
MEFPHSTKAGAFFCGTPAWKAERLSGPVYRQPTPDRKGGKSRFAPWQHISKHLAARAMDVLDYKTRCNAS